MALQGTVNINMNNGLLESIRGGVFGGQVGAGGIFGGIGRMVGSLGLIAGILNQMLGLLGTLVNLSQSMSGILRGSLSALNKTLGLLLKPIGDILGTALLPLVFMIRPIALFFNTLMKPYIQQAMKAARTGNVLLQQGETAGALQAFALSFQFLVKPLTDAFIGSMQIPINLVIGSIQTLGNLFIDIFNVGGMLNGLRATWNTTMENMKMTVTDSYNAINDVTNEFYTDSLNSLETWATQLKDRFQEALDESIPTFTASTRFGNFVSPEYFFTGAFDEQLQSRGV